MTDRPTPSSESNEASAILYFQREVLDCLTWEVSKPRRDNHHLKFIIITIIIYEGWSFFSQNGNVMMTSRVLASAQHMKSFILCKIPTRQTSTHHPPVFTYSLCGRVWLFSAARFKTRVLFFKQNENNALEDIIHTLQKSPSGDIFLEYEVDSALHRLMKQLQCLQSVSIDVRNGTKSLRTFLLVWWSALELNIHQSNNSDYWLNVKRAMPPPRSHHI